MNDWMNAVVFLKNINLNMFFLNTFERKQLNFLRVEHERITFLSEFRTLILLIFSLSRNGPKIRETYRRKMFFNVY